jgi:hypothetical protein
MPRKIRYFGGRRIKKEEVEKGEETRRYRRRKASGTLAKERNKGEREMT